MFTKPASIPTAEQALPGRAEIMQFNPIHQVLVTSMLAPFPEHLEQIVLGLGCFWGAERKFWQLPGVVSTAVGYSAGYTPNPTYEEVCSGLTGHNEVVKIVFDHTKVSFDAVLKVFWENHDPTQGMRQGNDRGTQYRSGIYYFTDAQKAAAESSLTLFQERLLAAGFGEITTEVLPAPTFYFAEEYHQQYLHKNPAGYCGMGGTGVACAIGTGA